MARTSWGAIPAPAASSRRRRPRSPSIIIRCPSTVPTRMADAVSRPIARSGARSSTRGSRAVRAASASRPEPEAGRDRAADEGAPRVDRVERRGRPAVDDDRGRAEELGRRVRVDQPVGPDLAGPVDLDGHRDRARGRHRARDPRAGPRPPRGLLQGRERCSRSRPPRPRTGPGRRVGAAPRAGPPARRGSRRGGSPRGAEATRAPSRARPSLRWVLPASITRSMRRS